MPAVEPFEPTAADVERVYPNWVTDDSGTDRRPRARRRGSIDNLDRVSPGAALTVVGDTWRDVFDEIPAAEARLLREAQALRDTRMGRPK